MSHPLFTKTPRVNESGELLVNYSANRVGGLQVGLFSSIDETKCVPFSQNEPPLENRKHLLMTFPTDRVWLGPPGVTSSTGYRIRGTKRGGFYNLTPAVSEYSNRMQFLRGQYTSLSLFHNVPFCVHIGPSVEDVFSLEMS